MRQCWRIHISDFINLVTLCLHFHPGLVLRSSDTGRDVGSHLIRLSVTLPSFRRYCQVLPTLVPISVDRYNKKITNKVSFGHPFLILFCLRQGLSLYPWLSWNSEISLPLPAECHHHPALDSPLNWWPRAFYRRGSEARLSSCC